MLKTIATVLVWGSVFMLATAPPFQKAGEKPPAPQAPADPTIKLNQRILQLSGQLEQCQQLVGEKELSLQSVKSSIERGVIGDVRVAQNAALSALAKAVETNKKNAGRYKIDLQTGEITVVESGK